jgi:hypothetical protein
MNLHLLFFFFCHIGLRGFDFQQQLIKNKANLILNYKMIANLTVDRYQFPFFRFHWEETFGLFCRASLLVGRASTAPLFR